MDESRKLVERIKRILEHTDMLPSKDQLSETATQYVRLCRQVNERLEQCDTWLSAGEECEAIRIADTFSVLEEFNILYGLSTMDWSNFCSSRGLEIPPIAAEKEAANLSRAYDLDAMTKKWTQRLRILALEQAPIYERLQVLYQLERLEPQSVLWNSMIPELEKRRFEEISQTLYALPETMTSQAELEKIGRELAETRWKSPVPEQIRQQSAAMLRSVRNQNCIFQLRQIAKDIQSYYSEMDVYACREGQMRWNNFILANRISASMLPRDLRESVDLAFTWLAEQGRQDELRNDFNDRMNSMEQALRENDLDEIISAYSALSIAAENGGFAIPSSLINSYRTRVNIIDLEKRRKLRLTIMMLVSVAVLVGVAFIWVGNQAMSARKNQGEADRIAAFLDAFEGKDIELKPDLNALDKAGKYIENLRVTAPEELDTPLVREQVSRYEALLAADQKRIGDFAHIRDLLSSLMEKGDSDIELVKSLDTLARSEQEKISAIQFRKKHVDLETKHKSKIDTDYRKILDELTSLEEEMERIPPEQQNDAVAIIVKLDEGFARLDKIANGVSPVWISQKEKLKIKVDTLTKKIRKEKSLFDDYRSLTEAVGHSAPYINALRKIAENQKDDAKNLNSIINDFTAIDLLLEWNSFVVTYGSEVNQWDTGSSTGTQANEARKKLKGKAEFIPEFIKVNRYWDEIEPFVAAGGRITLIKNLANTFEKYSKKVWCIYKSGSDRYYYFSSQPKSDELKLEYMVNRENETRSLYFDSDEVVTAYKAPHSEIAGLATHLLNPLLQRVDTKKWVEAVITILKQLDPGTEHKGFDPLVQAIILSDVLDILCKDPLFADPFAIWQNVYVESRDFDRFTNWYDSQGKQTKPQRKLAIALLQSLVENTKLDIRTEMVRKKAGEIPEFKSEQYRWVGYLNRENTRFYCEFAPNTEPKDGALYLCRVSSISQKPELIRLGEYKNGKATISDSLPGLLRGLPVFLLETNMTEVKE